MIKLPYPNPDAHPAIARHLASAPDAKAKWGCALDVWRDGVHLWRSYVPKPGATVDAWADATLPPGTALNHDEGIWGVPHVSNIADWPIPAHVGVPMGLQAIHDLMVTALAVGQLPHAPEGLDNVPARGAINQRILTADSGLPVVIKVHAAGVSVRCLVAPVTVGRPESPVSAEVVTWRAELSRRHVRSGAIDAQLQARVVTFEAPADTPPHILSRPAKAALGIPGWPAQRRPKEPVLTWNLSRAPYKMTIEKV